MFPPASVAGRGGGEAVLIPPPAGTDSPAMLLTRSQPCRSVSPVPAFRALRRIGLVAAFSLAGGATVLATELLPAAGEPPPVMYLPDPGATGSVAGLPAWVDPDRPPPWPRWEIAVNGLVMTRTIGAGTATMQPLADGRQLTTGDAAATWPGGVELRVGRWFGERQRQALEVVYWGGYGIGSSAGLSAAPPTITAIPQPQFPGVTVGGVPATLWLDDASAQELGRTDLVNNVEINWILAGGERPEFPPRSQSLHFAWLAGFRFFQVGDTLSLATTAADPAAGALLFQVATNNNLLGGQLGARLDWRFAERWRIDVVPKFMIAGNALTNTTTLSGPGGTPALFAGGIPVDVHATGSVFSWLGSLDAAVAWDITDRWTLSIGYRLVGVGDIAQADGQWPPVLVSAGALETISAGSSTLVHGGFAGFVSRF